MQATVSDVDGLDPKAAKKVDFYTRQFIDAMAPSNFVATNPEVLRKTLADPAARSWSRGWSICSTTSSAARASSRSR